MGFIIITRETPDGKETWDWDSAPEYLKEEIAFEIELREKGMRL